MLLKLHLLVLGVLSPILFASAVDLGGDCDPFDTRSCTTEYAECLLDNYGDPICQCTEGTFHDTNFNRCIHTPRWPLDPCIPTEVFCNQIPNSECAFVDHICRCLTEYSLDTQTRKCLATPLRPGHICTIPDIPCTTVTPEQTYCGAPAATTGSRICECFDPEVTDTKNNLCLKKPSLPGDSCDPFLTPCTPVIDTTCRNVSPGDWQCICNDGLVLNEDVKVCLVEPRRPGESCHEIWAKCDKVPEPTQCLIGPGNKFMCMCSGADQATDTANSRCLEIPQKPGDSCYPPLTDCSNVQNCECFFEAGDKSYCKCQGDFVTLIGQGRCLEFPLLPGDECHPNLAPCPMQTTYCRSLKCTCNDGLITDEDTRRCLTIPRAIGDPCSPSLAPCNLIPNSVCDPTGLHCSCMQDYVYYPTNGTCLSAPLYPGDACDPFLLPCDNVQDATTCAEKPNTGGREYYCKCDTPLINDPVKPRCLPTPSYPLDLCHPTQITCINVPSTICVKLITDDEFRCRCDEGFIHDSVSKRCISRPRKPGDPCEPNLAQCNLINNTRCELDLVEGHTCRCIGNLITDNGYCFPPPRLPNDQCSINVPAGFCTLVENTDCIDNSQGLEYFQCKCTGDLVTDPIGRCIDPPEFPMDPCHPTLAPCPLNQNTTCSVNPDGSGSNCFCASNLIHDAFGSRCIDFPSFPGDACEPNQAPCDNVNKTMCEINIINRYHDCKCAQPLITDRQRCFLAPTLPGQQCTPDQVVGNCDSVVNTTCSIHPVDPNNPVCICGAGFFTDFEKFECIPNPTMPGDPCVNNCELLDNSECIDSICQCMQDYFNFQGQCIPLPRLPGDRCETINHCTTIPGTLCLQQMCTCEPNEWDLSTDGSICIKKADLLGGYCETTVQCSKLDLTDCLNNQCSCLNETVPAESNTKCLHVATKIGDICQENLQCLSGIGNGSFCQGTCKCHMGYLPSLDLLRCVESEDPGVGCQISSQCWPIFGPYSYCDTNNTLGTCLCNADSVLVGGLCVIVAGLGDSCSTTEQCVRGVNEYAVCDELTDICVCSEQSYEWGATCHKRVELLGPCIETRECQLSLNFTSVICKDFICVCGFGHVINDVGDAPCKRSGALFHKMNIFFLTSFLVLHSLLK